MDYQLFKEIIGLSDPWQVREVELDMPSNRLDITLAYGKPKKSFFRWGNSSEPKLTTVRHLPTMGMRTFLHIPSQALADDPPLELALAVRMTGTLRQWVQTAVKGANSFQNVAEVTGIIPGDVRGISEGSGIWVRSGRPEDEDKAVAHMSVPGPAVMDRDQSFDILASDIVPPETHRNWQLMIDGDFPINTNAVGLNMLLHRVRHQVQRDLSEINRLRGAKALRQYFIKNQHIHGAEIKLLNSEMTPVISTVPTMPQDEVHQGDVMISVFDEIPNENHTAWDDLLYGRIRLRTQDIGLQMMLERLSQSVAQNPDEQWRDNAKRVLRQFFQKHQRKLAAEMSQLGFVPAIELVAAAAEPGMVAVPDESHSCWGQLLVSKSVTIDTQRVSLQMMLERIYMSLAQNPSESNLVIAVKLLRQYFTKHQHSHQPELRQLTGMPPQSGAQQSAGDVAAVVSVPREIDVVWQRLIDGNFNIDTNMVALNMIVKQVRLSVAANPSAFSRIAGAKLLRQYFIKHQHSHQPELRQLAGMPLRSGSQRSAGNGLGTVVSVPLETDVIWQKLIDGEFNIDTNMVALNMIVEQVRLSVENNPSESSRTAGAKLLRQYFIKHQQTHQAELNQLVAA